MELMQRNDVLNYSTVSSTSQHRPSCYCADMMEYMVHVAAPDANNNKYPTSFISGARGVQPTSALKRVRVCQRNNKTNKRTLTKLFKKAWKDPRRQTQKMAQTWKTTTSC
ncbi:hypothetical protein KOW79_004037 [Hemibagrus wyckioides]|uniref:Uncharacterized protein n=1 Tax=Hemibagrus wyckioides TaxID=337641 RepID=A0A9D3P3F3_9TELE|nr:hypothetical protein KOW79_004037 [Hemibagrus wyckioides]